MKVIPYQQSRAVFIRHVLACWRERLITGALGGSAFISVAVTLGIICVLISESSSFFAQVDWREFLFGREWAPLFEPRKFGVLPIVMGTLVIAFYSSLIAVPLGLLVAIYLSEYAPPRQRRWLKPMLEILAGIPSVVFGYFAVESVTPLLRGVLPSTEVFNAASAAVVVGFMTLPMVASLSDDAIGSVPRSLRDGAYAMGATKAEVILGVVLPGAIAGIVAAFILAFSRAVGETMAVTLAAGTMPTLGFNPLVSMQTMTGYIVQVSLGDTPHGSIEYQSLFSVGLLLFVITMGVNLLARLTMRWLQRRYS